MEEDTNSRLRGSRSLDVLENKEEVCSDPMPSSSHTNEIVEAARKSKRKGWIHCSSVPSHHHRAIPHITAKYQPPKLTGPSYDDEEVRHNIMENIVTDAMEVNYDNLKGKDKATYEEEIKYHSSFTRVGRMGAWHPEASLVKGWPEGYPLYVVPPPEELQERYKLPTKRLRKREDGLGGATLFQPEHPLPPPGVEDIVMDHCLLPSNTNITTELPSRGAWNQVLQSYKTGLKRGLGGQNIGPRKKIESHPVKHPTKKIDKTLDPSTTLEFPNLKTGDDVVMFFLEQEEQPRVKFFYCNQVNYDKVFLPYDLEVVKREDCNDEYFCISVNGIVHIEPDQEYDQEGTFIPLQEWMREKYVFTYLRTVKFFGKYLIFKAFTIWRKHIRQRNFQHVKTLLIKKWFYAKPQFYTALNDVHGMIHDVTTQSMLSIVHSHLYVMEDFSQIQFEERVHKSTPTIEQCVEKVEQVLTKLCEEAVRQAQIYRESVRDEAELNDTIGVNLHQTRGSKVQSMVSIKHEKIERAKTYRRVMAEEKMLGNFVRLVDYIFTENLIHHTVMNTSELYALLESTRPSPDKVNKGIFSTTLSFKESAIVFTPNELDTLLMCTNIIDGFIQTLQAAPRILFMRVFSGYFEEKCVGANPVSILKATPKYIQLRGQIESLIRKDFSDARKYAEMFEEYRELFAFGETWSFEVYAKEKRTVKQYREEMARQREWRIDLEKMKIGQVVGILHVDSKSLRNSLIPITNRTLDLIKGHLVQISHDETILVLDAFHQKIDQLKLRPVDLDGFVNYIIMFEQIIEKKKISLAEAAVIDDMYDLLAAYEVKIPANDQVKFDDLHDCVILYGDSMEQADLFIEERKPSMKQTLDNKVTTLSEELLTILGTLHSGKFLVPESDQIEVVADLEKIKTRIAQIRALTETYKSYQKLFNMHVDDMTNLILTEKEFNLRYNVWKALHDWIIMTERWRTCPVSQLKGGECFTNTDEYAKAAYKMGKANKEDTVVFRLKDAIDEFKKVAPLIEELANDALKERHWTKIFEIIGKKYTPELVFSINDLLDMNVMPFLEEIKLVSATASKEYSFEKTLDKMEKDWEGVEFIVVPYKDSGTYIVGGIDDIQTILDDQIVKVSSMCASPFIKFYEYRATTWRKLVVNLQELVDNWVECQATWQYLGPIFGSKDIMRQMPEEGEKFQTVDQTWRDLMKKTVVAPGCLVAGRDLERLEKLKEANRLLELINKGLAQYLEIKRIAFPRFFFLSNDEMLEILSETKDPLRVQPHLKKCFEGINTLHFEPNLDITAMISLEEEVVPLVDKFNPKTAAGAVEKWLLQANDLCLFPASHLVRILAFVVQADVVLIRSLGEFLVGQVEEGMVTSVQDQCARGVAAYAETVREKWVLEWPGQIVLVVCAIYWTTASTEAIRAGGTTVAEFEQVCTDQLGRVVRLVRGNLTKLNRATLSALVVMDVHARDTITVLAKEEGVKETDFVWQSQLRMYWEEKTCMVRMMNCGVEYGYEYLGNSSRLVITPLTDRCYRTLMGAIHLNLGGAPEGPAGTGKTETTKDLAKAVARQCVVFNCSDSLDYLAMAKFFKGLAASGAWACFDEFNRIDLEVLSVVAQQVLEIQLAVQNKVKTFTFEGSELTLKPSCNVFITMNPGYAGRSELPDNLKALFRSVAMMVPDYAMISEIILYSAGYLQARDSARKIVATYRLCSEQLSSQEHYDYGMRAVMAVLRAASNLKQRYPDEDEYVLMLRSIIDVNLCKFLSQDVPLFNGIVTDLFPGVILPEPDYTLLDKGLRDNCQKRNLQPTKYFMTKCIQLYEMIIVRHGLMLVGLPFSGKTCAIRVLQGALTDLSKLGNNEERRVQVSVVNPKAVTMGQLYGANDPMTMEWLDGVLAIQFRVLASDPSKDRKWLVLDGPVDAIWIENMNTVLDDNKKLCLPNSEIIQMSPSMNMIFEVGDLAVASPATVSRCGMVYLEPHQLGWHPLMLSWMNTLPKTLNDATKKHLQGLYEWLVPACLKFKNRHIKDLNPNSDTMLVNTLMRTFYSLILELKTEDGVKALGKEKLTIWIDSIFIFCLTWSIGATGENDGRIMFDKFLRVLVTGTVPQGYELWVPEKHETLLCQLPSDESGSTLHEYMFDKNISSWRTWMDTIVPMEIPEEANFSEIIIPTKDQMRYTYLLDKAIQYGSPMLMVGSTGTGKSVYVNRHLLQGLNRDKFSTVLVCFSAKTSANMTQSQIDGSLDRRKRGFYGPTLGKKCVIFVDDLNMPQPEVYGAQPPIELLRQYMDHGGWYGRDNAFRNLLDVQFVAAMGPPGGGRSLVTSRYTRHFNSVAMSLVAEDSLQLIFTTILNWHYTIRSQFPYDVAHLGKVVISATMKVYNEARTKLLPTPTKSHYTFNLRDYARVIQGIMLQDSSTVKPGKEGGKQHIRLWVHECLRVFYDRLVDDADRSWLITYLKDLTKTDFEEDFDKLFARLKVNPDTNLGQTEMRRCMFGDFVIEDPDNRVYDEIIDIPSLIAIVENYLKDFNGVSKRPMNLAIFLFAVEHISRICRILKQPGGNMLLVGVGGSGRQSLTRLAASIYGMEVFQVEISKSYTKVEWREDLKLMLRKCGADPGNPGVFLFSDTQITDEGFVEDINNLLNSGEIPNMYPSDEKAQVTELAREKAKKAGKIVETIPEIWRFFVDQCQQKCHVIFCMSPAGQAFRNRLRQFPSLVNCCTIDWFQEWPEDALEAVALKFLKTMNMEESIRTSIVRICKAFHENVRVYSIQFKEKLGRYNYLTPTSYLELITSFQTLLNTTQEDNVRQRRRYEVGLEKLASSAVQVAVMQEELTELKPKLIVTVEEVQRIMAIVEKEKKDVVEPKKQIVQHDEAEASKQAGEAKAIKDECEAALAVAMPALNEALSALDTLSVNDINYVKKLTNPPAAIKLVMEAVCVILDVKPSKMPDGKGGHYMDYWKPSVTVLNNKDFLKNLKEYDKDNIEPKIIAKVRANYTTNPEFTPEKAAHASIAAEGLCKWICAMDKYDVVAKVVSPKKQKLKAAEDKYNTVMVGLRAKQKELKDLMDKLGELEANLDVMMGKKENLQHEVKMCTVKLERAEQLIGGLGGERVRWINAAKELAAKYDDLTGDALIAAGVIAYLGAFTASYRQEIIDGWVKLCSDENIPRSANFSLKSILGNPVRIREWMIAGLPNDAVSIDNGIVVANARRWPLMIDPQGQANKWIRNMERERNLQIIKLGTEYGRVLENAIQFGLPVILENIGEEIDPALEPLLLKQIFKSGGMMCIKLGDTVIEYNNDFRFYITTKLRNPHYLPEIAVKVTLLNFMITKDGLSDQLLGVVVARERPDLETQKSELVLQSANNKRRLKELEDQILEVLSSSEGNILEDETAIKIISESKVVGNDITVKQAMAEVTEKNIDEARKGYASCGEYAAVLFFCISDLANVDPMYQYSLVWFTSLFVVSISSSKKSTDLVLRLTIIQDHFLLALYNNICRSLFEKDKLLFSCLLAIRLLQMKGYIDVPEWLFFLTGGVGAAALPNPAPEWLPDKAWAELNRLGRMPAFSKLIPHMMSHLNEWKVLFDSLEPHKETLPGDLKPDAFQKLMLMRCMRPDKVIPAIQDFVIDRLGVLFVQPPIFNLEASYKDSNAAVPLIFVLSAGSDPTASLLKFAADKEMSEKIFPISLGQGQGPKAITMIKDAQVAGTWVLLQNCHLAPSWMPTLDRICEAFATDSVHQDFRIWMTSYPSPQFPITILQNGLKMTFEPPRGIRANMKRSFTLDPISNEEFFESCKKPAVFKSLLFGLCFFHAVVQERRTFGPLGWNVPYGFDDGDLRISVRQLNMLINEAGDLLPLDALNYVTGECNYGGRVTDDKDRLLLNTILRSVYNLDSIHDGYKLSESGIYLTPPLGNVELWNKVVDEFPVIPAPEAFGLHSNADITKNMNGTNLMLNSMLMASADMVGGGGGASSKSTDAGVKAVVKEILSTLPPNFDIEASELKYPVMYEESMNTVLSQEMTRFNRLLDRIRSSCASMEKAIDGTVVMSADLETAYRSIAVNQVPAMWSKVSYPSLKPLSSYTKDLLERLNMLQKWFEKGVPAVHWVSGFFFAQSFMTAALQNYARRKRLAIDTLAFNYYMLDKEPTEAPEIGIYIRGLYLEGCGWDPVNKCLCESKAKVLYVPAPMMWLKPVLITELELAGCYNCPVYRTAERRGTLATTGHSTNFLMYVRMPSKHPPSHWIKRGVAMLCGLSD